MHAHMHGHTRTHRCTRMHTHSHAHTHARAQLLVPSCISELPSKIAALLPEQRPSLFEGGLQVMKYLFFDRLNMSLLYVYF